LTVKPTAAGIVMIRVLAADHHPLYRDGLARLVRQSPLLELVAEIGDVREMQEAVREHAPDVVLVEPQMLGADPRAFLAELSKRTRLVLIAGSARPADPYHALGAGVCGYLSKCATHEQLADAIRRVAAGQTIIAPEIAGDVAADIRLRETRPGTPLSPREREVLAFLADGLTAAEIAERLQLGVSTVRTHKLKLYEKLGVADRGAAVAEGWRRGLLH
jgi:two-component system, NarL family, nitrate/nitrite response regulator NarL